MLAKHALSVRRCFSIPLLLVHFSFVNFSSNARSFVSDKIPYLRDKASHMAFVDGKSSYKCTRSSGMQDSIRNRALRSFLDSSRWRFTSEGSSLLAGGFTSSVMNSIESFSERRYLILRCH